MSDGPVVLFLHGGGFIVCSIGTHRVLGARVAAGAGGRSLMVGYRLAPEHPFPQPVEDCVAAYRWLLEEGVAPERIAFFGDSAGGNLCLAAGLLAARDGIPLPAAMVLASPAPDLTFSGPSNVAKRDVDPFSRIDNPARMVEYYLRGADPRDPLASPVFADLTGFPPLLIMVGPDETLVDDCHALAERATKCGVDTELQVVEGAFHTWLGYAGVVPEADDCITRIGTFIAKHTRGTL
jgi:acetyl esterase/lipase